MAYVYKYVNGKRLTVTSGDQTVLAARDAANWGNTPDATAMRASGRTDGAAKVAQMAKAFGLTLDELKAELAK